MRTLRSPAGFTLIEMLVVVFIIGIVAAGVMLSVNLTGTDHELETESERLATLMNYARGRGRDSDARVWARLFRHRLCVLRPSDPRTALWANVTEDDALRPRTLPAGLTLKLNVEDTTSSSSRRAPRTRRSPTS